MKAPKKLSLSALVAALCVICLAMGSVLTRISLSLAALAGLFPAAAVILCGYGWAAGSALTAGLLALLLLPDKTGAIWFLCFFGHYPLWKALIERFQTERKKPWLGWLLKLLGFGICMTVLYLLFARFFAGALPFGLGDSTAGPLLLVPALLAAYVIYDVAFSILIGWFRINVLPKLK